MLRIYVHPFSKKGYNESVAQCEAMSQLGCPAEILNENSPAARRLMAVLQDSGVATGDFWFHRDAGRMS